MARATTRTAFVCSACGSEQGKWFGRCPDCDAWNTAGEVTRTPPARGAVGPGGGGPAGAAARVSSPRSLAELAAGGAAPRRLATGIGELDRVLGGGLVPGSLVLIGGDPGIGKSTLVAPARWRRSGARGCAVLYVTGEESRGAGARCAPSGSGVGPRALLVSPRPISRRVARATSRRLGPPRSGRRLDPDPVSRRPRRRRRARVTQVRECGLALLHFAEGAADVPVLPGRARHQGRRGRRARACSSTWWTRCSTSRASATSEYRVLRAAKNRFGSTARARASSR